MLKNHRPDQAATARRHADAITDVALAVFRLNGVLLQWGDRRGGAPPGVRDGGGRHSG